MPPFPCIFAAKSLLNLSSIQHTPVCIVGAGPAGITAALHLQKAGVECVLVDRQTLPQDKFRGEVFDGRVLHALRRLDPGYLDELEAMGMFVKNRGAEFVRSSGAHFTVRFPDSMPPRLLALRTEFDAFLRAKVQNQPGITLLEGVEIASLDFQPNGVMLTSSSGDVRLRAQLLVDASGCLSRLSGALQRDEQRYGRDHLWVSQCLEGVALKSPTDLLLHPLPRHKTVLMVSPLPGNRVGIGLGIRHRDLQRLGLNPMVLLEEAFVSLLQHHPELGQGSALQKAKGTVIRLSTRRHQLAGERYLLAGAADYSLNPVSGFGVGHAMTAGELAAKQAMAAVQAQDYSHRHLQGYQLQVYRALRTELWLSQLITGLLDRPRWFVPMVFRLGTLFRRVLTTPDFTRQFLKPSFYWRMLFTK
ncbi:MAG TPA: hypothetical protein DCR93_32505 [Cytophagales bacterium]|nr:hypothetical protein [Cytophagales bacterium]